MIKKDKIISFFLSAGLTAVMLTVPGVYVHAEEKPALLKKAGNWESYSYSENGGKVCFMAAAPASRKGNYNSRGDTFLLITHRSAEKTKDVISFVAGYAYKTGSSVTVSADGKKFTLFTQGDTAWAADGATDKRLTQAILKGNKIIVTGTSSRGTLTTDTFSLKGAAAAYKIIGNACKM